MINREIIRNKIVQLTYAYYLNGNKNIDTAEKELFFSLSKAYDLYNHLLSLIVAVTKEAQRRLEVTQGRAKREGTEEPSQKFAYNRFAIQLQENKALNEFISNQKTDWADTPIPGQLFETIESSEIYKDYMSSSEDSYDADRELWRKLYKTFIQENSDLDALLEDQSLYWNDDKEIVDTFVLKTIKRFKEQNGAKEELLPEWDSDEEKEFARKLFRSAILNEVEYQHYMNEVSRNWDLSRLAYMDIVLMQIAIAEMMTLPNIPISVTINEYVELAKLYSTPKSGGYINGMLDAIARNLVTTGRLMKYIEPKKEKAKKSKLEKSVDEDATKKKRNQDRRREQALASQLNDLPEYKKWRRIWWAVLIVAVVACVASFAVSQMRTTGQIPTDVADAVAPVTLVLGYGGIIAALVIDLVKIRGMRKELEAQAHTMSKAQLRKLDASIEASDRAYEEEREKRKSRRPWNKKKDQAADAEADEK